jgi:hypothetical protein
LPSQSAHGNGVVRKTPTAEPKVSAMTQAQAAVMSVHAVPSISVWK